MPVSVRLLILMLLLAIRADGVAAEYYFHASNGSDTSGDGTRAAPWASLAKASELDLLPGDRLRFAGGESFSGSLALTAKDAGTAANPVMIDSYGVGRAIIAPGVDQHGIDIYNTAGIEIHELVIDGGDLSEHEKAGIQAYCDLPGDDTRLSYLVIADCELRNLHNGIAIGAWGNSADPYTEYYSGFADVTIEGVLVHDCEHEGIVSWGMYPGSATKQSHRNITVRDCEVFGVTGDPAKTGGGHSGSGIILSGTIGGLIDGCYAHHNGGSGSFTGGGPVGIWTWDAVDVTIRRCLVHDQRTIAGAVDGGGFDFDGGAVGCTIEYCYSYDNDGPGFLLAEFNGAGPLHDNHVRYSVSHNDGRANRMGGIHFWNGSANATRMRDCLFYNNLIVAGPDTTGPVVDHQSGGVSGMLFSNNIFVTRDGLDLVKINSNTDGFRFVGNLWHAIDSDHDYRWAGTTHSSLSDWRTATGTPETWNGSDTGYETDPLLEGLDVLPRPTSIAELDHLIALRLTAASPGVDAGIDLNAAFAIDPGERDFVGHHLYQGGAPDIAPHERGARTIYLQAHDDHRWLLDGRPATEQGADPEIFDDLEQGADHTFDLGSTPPG